MYDNPETYSSPSRERILSAAVRLLCKSVTGIRIVFSDGLVYVFDISVKG